MLYEWVRVEINNCDPQRAETGKWVPGVKLHTNSSHTGHADHDLDHLDPITVVF